MNVLLVTADQWRADCLWRHAGSPTPNLARLAADAVTFQRHHAQATPCGPSRASLHTGTYAFNHRSIANGAPLDSTLTTMALEARRAGYDPVLFGYTDTSADPRVVPAGDPRLLTYEGVLPGYRAELLLLEKPAAWLDHLAARGYGRMTVEEAYATPLGAPARWRAEDSETAFLTGAFIDWLLRRPRGRPWFAHLSLIKPHPPWVAAAPFHDRVPADTLPPPVRRASPEAEAALHSWVAGEMRRSWPQTLPPGHPRVPADMTAPVVATLRRVYLGLVAEVDHWVGRVLEALERRGEIERTLIVVTADHGEMLGDHWMLGKSGFFPQAFHVPLLIRLPGGRPGEVQAFTEHVDLMPTVLDALGAPVPMQCDGRSLRPFLESAAPAGWRDAAIYEHDSLDLAGVTHRRRHGLAPGTSGLVVCRGERWALVHFAGGPPLLFDQEADPGWTTNLATDVAHAPVLAAETGAMLSHRMRHADRRLAWSQLTPQGVLGRYDQLPAAAASTVLGS